MSLEIKLRILHALLGNKNLSEEDQKFLKQHNAENIYDKKNHIESLTRLRDHLLKNER